MINDGNTDLKDIAREIGKTFNIDIKDNLYRTYTNINNRKNSNSKFMQSLADTFQKRLAEHQMNQEFFKAFGKTNPTLPLKDAGQITHGNATTVDWELVCPKRPNDEIYILGNPP